MCFQNAGTYLTVQGWSKFVTQQNKAIFIPYLYLICAEYFFTSPGVKINKCMHGFHFLDSLADARS